jgi:ABC-type transporter Mla MlaB component
VIHIRQTNEGRATLHLHLEGMLDQVHCIALREVVAEAHARKLERFVLHCAGLAGADAAGFAFLLTLKDEGATFVDLQVSIAWHLGLLNTTEQGSN